MPSVSEDAGFALATCVCYALLVALAACGEAPLGFAPERSVRAEPTVGQSDAGATGCPLLCDQGGEATFSLTCAPNDLASVTLTGPCAYLDAGSTTYIEHNYSHPWIRIASGRPGVCNVALIFANGFAYSANVTFTLQADDGPPGCPACPASITPTQLAFMVNNPSTTCLDAGTEAEADATADALPGCTEGCQ